VCASVPVGADATAANIVLMRLRKSRHPEVSLDAATEAREEDARPFLELGEPGLRLGGMLDNITLRKAIDQLHDRAV
jgi:hypothetical protein